MSKIPRTKEKALKEIAKQLPPIPIIKDPDMLIDKLEGEVPVYLTNINHKRRILKAYRDLGDDGVQKYLGWLREYIIKLSKIDLRYVELANRIQQPDS